MNTQTNTTQYDTAIEALHALRDAATAAGKAFQPTAFDDDVEPNHGTHEHKAFLLAVKTADQVEKRLLKMGAM